MFSLSFFTRPDAKAVFLLAGTGLVLASGFWQGTGDPSWGEGAVPAPLPFTIKNAAGKSWQQNVETRRDRLFGFRNDWVRIKDTIYDWANWRLFHTSYGGNILQGKRGFIFEKIYVLNQFNWSRNTTAPERLTQRNLTAVRELQDALAPFGVKVVLNLFPNKVSQLPLRWPVIWHEVAKHHPQRTNYYALYEKAGAELGVPVINQQRHFYARQSENHLWFPKTGTHWTLAMAAAAVPLFVDELKKDARFATLAAPAPTRYGWDNRALHCETDIWDLLNLVPSLQKKKPGAALYPYPLYDARAPQAIPITAYGDSFNFQWEQALQGAGIMDPAAGFREHNKNLSHEQVFDIVRRGGVLSLGYSLANLSTPRMADEARVILGYLKKARRSAGWTGEHPEWTGPHSAVEFLRPGGEKQDVVMTIRSHDVMRGVQSLTICLNGSPLNTYAPEALRGTELKITLPAALLQVGVNRLDFDTVRAGMPISYQINGDQRQLGVLLSFPTFAPRRSQ